MYIESAMIEIKTKHMSFELSDVHLETSDNGRQHMLLALRSNLEVEKVFPNANCGTKLIPTSCKNLKRDILKLTGTQCVNVAVANCEEAKEKFYCASNTITDDLKVPFLIRNPESGASCSTNAIEMITCDFSVGPSVTEDGKDCVAEETSCHVKPPVVNPTDNAITMAQFVEIARVNRVFTCDSSWTMVRHNCENMFFKEVFSLQPLTIEGL